MTTFKRTLITETTYRGIRIIKEWSGTKNGGKGGYDYIVPQRTPLGLHHTLIIKDFDSAAAAKRFIDSRLDR